MKGDFASQDSGLEPEAASIYLDYAATTPVDPEIWGAMGQIAVKHFGNPSSQHHAWGRSANKVVFEARQAIGSECVCAEDEIIFTSGATESNALVFSSVLYWGKRSPTHVVMSAFEHPSVLNWGTVLEQAGVEITRLLPNSEGVITLDSVQRALKDHTKLVSVMTVQNEIGVAQPTFEIGRYLNSTGVLFHTDAAQATGRVMLSHTLPFADFVSLSAHKCFGPKGVGALIQRPLASGFIRPAMVGGGQQNGVRPGTLPVAQIAGLAMAIERAQQRLRDGVEVQIRLREELFLTAFRSFVTDAEIVADGAHRVPGILMLRIPGVDVEQLMAHNREVGISNGSACHSGSILPPLALMALGLSTEVSGECARICVSHNTSDDEATFAAQSLGKCAARLRRRSRNTATVSDSLIIGAGLENFMGRLG